MPQRNLSEKIRMMAEFNNGKIKPLVFVWNGRNHKVKKINLPYEQREGQSVNYYFGIETTDGGVFKIRYNDVKLAWWLEEQWEE